MRLDVFFYGPIEIKSGQHSNGYQTLFVACTHILVESAFLIGLFGGCFEWSCKPMMQCHLKARCITIRTTLQDSWKSFWYKYTFFPQSNQQNLPLWRPSNRESWYTLVHQCFYMRCNVPIFFLLDPKPFVYSFQWEKWNIVLSPRSWYIIFGFILPFLR